MEDKHHIHNSKRLVHVIIVAPPFQGHINPSIQLTLKLAAKGFTVTFVNTHWTHHQITKARQNNSSSDDLFAGSRGSGLDIRYETISDGFPLSFDRTLKAEQFMEGRLHVFPAHVDELVGKLMTGKGPGSDPPPTCLVADTFQTWGYHIARKYGLVFVSLWTQPAMVLTLYYHLDLLKKNQHYGCFNDGTERKDNIDYVPGVGSIKPSDLMSFLQETDTSNVMHKVIDKAFTYAKKADFLIFNTIDELEPEPITLLKAMQPTYAIGPLFPSRFDHRSVEMDLWSESDCKEWLDGKPHDSVLYISFGSLAHTNKKVIKEIANGLMLSGINFIWVLRSGTSSSSVTEILPNRFEENAGDRGLVVPWCKQNAVLSHVAVGGFLTHCGWNSILESVWCGVPMICYPLVGDQTTNRKLVVDDWRIGIDLCEKEVVSSNEIAERFNCFMMGESSQAMQKEIEDVRKKLKNAVANDGSSQTSFNEFADGLENKIQKHHSRNT